MEGPSPEGEGFTDPQVGTLNQVEQWFSILHRKRLSAPNFANLDQLEARLEAFVHEWNESAHPFHWTKQSFAKVLAQVETSLASSS